MLQRRKKRDEEERQKCLQDEKNRRLQGKASQSAKAMYREEMMRREAEQLKKDRAEDKAYRFVGFSGFVCRIGSLFVVSIILFEKYRMSLFLWAELLSKPAAIIFLVADAYSIVEVTPNLPLQYYNFVLSSPTCPLFRERLLADIAAERAERVCLTSFAYLFFLRWSLCYCRPVSILASLTSYVRTFVKPSLYTHPLFYIQMLNAVHRPNANEITSICRLLRKRVYFPKRLLRQWLPPVELSHLILQNVACRSVLQSESHWEELSSLPKT